jgi:DNA-binding SARP family transcriptional activator
MIEILDTPRVVRREPGQDEHGDETLVCLLGSFRLLRYGSPLALPISGKAMQLLSVLALHHASGVLRETLLDLLWPEQETAQATVSLNSLVYSLHRRLRDARHGGSAVVYANGAYALNTAAGFGTDIARFDALVKAGDRLAAAVLPAEATVHYELAAGLYRGDLCSGADVYAVIERERLRASYLTVLAWLADRAASEGDHTAALEYALRLLACEPCREDAHRLVMRAHVRRGERAQALRQYRLCEQVLREEFDAVPEALTTELFNRIRHDAARI